MDTAELIRTARQRRGLTLRALAERAGTSHSTLSAYETRTKTPTVATLERILRAAGYAIDGEVERRVTDGDERGSELVAVLELAEQFPARHAARLTYPRFGRVT
jgi:transcriptional regulator with XRE-family HTH domain